MEFIATIDDLEKIYGTPVPAAMVKVAHQLTPLYRRWIMASRFCVLTTVGPDGTDGSPRGDDGPVVVELDEKTLALPDWHGNNRIDSLRNIVRDGRVSLMFMVPGSNNVVRLNGEARLTTDTSMTSRFDQNGRNPRSVIIIRIREIYTQCARALIRSELWTGQDKSTDLPTVGQILAEMSDGEVGGLTYDDDWAERAAKTMW
ncbi:pyridoxamine 5'-phosphate oxidase family protein [Parasulfitobacter algicola]|uniref:Pyridoxamine 5'-phosphate oxidase family protein n=1 Tax=Parasulfitobacter algicola TaxID=2614809 RepID=A0ABX2ILW9_9RHOB|nr:pyridoxamine 5'-phosphate oxidase family protein [Sulfitobacter algicola]NSX53854.1 pyridoxamine 5'-phosphate oxidase family protein [Sulfitobacter algicola]